MVSPGLNTKVTLRRYKTVFHKAHATVRERAILPREYGVFKDKIFIKLVDRKILVDAGSERYYYDDVREQYLIKRASLQVVFVLAAIIFIIFGYFLWKTN